MPPGGSYAAAAIVAAIVSLFAVDRLNLEDPWNSVIPVAVLIIGLTIAGWRFSRG